MLVELVVGRPKDGDDRETSDIAEHPGPALKEAFEQGPPVEVRRRFREDQLYGGLPGRLFDA